MVAGVVVDVLSNGKRPASSLCKTSGGQTLCQTAAQDAITSSNRMALAGDITWIAGAAAVAAGVVLILVRRSPRRPAAAAAPPATAAAPPAAWLSPAPGGLMLGGRF